MSGLFLMAVLAASPPPKATTPPRPTPAIVHVAVELPDPDQVKLRLRAKGSVGPLAPLASQHLFLGNLALPLEGVPDVAVLLDGFEASFVLPLASVPEKVLELDPHAMPVRFEARDKAGKTVFVAEGTLDLGDPGLVAIPVKRAYELYARLDHFALRPSITSFAFSALLSLYNPFSFPVTVRHLEYRLTTGNETIFRNSRPGFRLRPRQRSDVLLEQDIPFTALGSATNALLNQQDLAFSAKLVLLTPSGEHAIPLFFGR